VVAVSVCIANTIRFFGATSVSPIAGGCWASAARESENPPVFESL
jgi:hypothetical protein